MGAHVERPRSSGSHGWTGPTAPHTSPPAPPPDRPQDGPRRGLIVAAGIALVGGLALGIGALALAGRGGDEGGKTAADPPPSSTVPQAGTQQQQPVTAAQLAAARPRKLAVRRVGRTGTLAWTLPPGARQLPLLVQQQPAGSKPITTVPAPRTATVPGLRPKVRYCFKVGAVLRLNEGQAPDVAWSKPACDPARPRS